MQKHRKIAYLVFGLSTACLLSMANNARAAMDIHPILKIVDIKATKTQENGGDEVYVQIAEYDSNGSSRAFTVPRLPLTWPSKHIDQVDDVQIWGGVLSKDQSTSLVVSFMDHDESPFNTDDLIGVFKLNIKNKNGKLVSDWTIPNVGIKPEAVEKYGHHAQRMHFTNNGEDYVIDVALEGLASPKKMKSE
jgi:hypothetical protein